MDCSKARSLLSEWTDGRLKGPVGQTLEAHFRECAACRKEEQAFRVSWELLGNYPPIEPSPGLAAGVMKRVRRPLVWKLVAPLMAAAAAAVISVVVFFKSPPPQPEPPATEEERELVENLDLLENFDAIATLEMVADESAAGDGRVILDREEHK